MKNWQFLYESNQLSRFSCLNFLRNKQVRTRTIKITLATPTCSFLLHFLTKKIPMTTTMASLGLLIHLLLLATLFARILAPKLPITSTLISPFRCNTLIKSCNASLHHISNTVPKEKVASFYSVNVSQMKPIMYGNNIQDYLISVPCSCMDLDDNTTAYFYNTTYPVQHGDTFDQVSVEIYSGQAWKGKANYSGIDAKNNLSISLPCGCIESQSQTVVTYTVQDKDTLLSIASFLSSDVTGIQSLNQEMVLNPSNIGLDWLLFVPMENNPKKGDLLIKHF